MAFAGRAVLVAGGAGNIGSGIVQEFLKQGAKVAVVSRSKEKFLQLKEKTREDAQGRLTLIEANVSTEDGAKKIFEEVKRQTGGVQHVVASIGSYWEKGRLGDQSLAEFNDRIQDMVVGHFLLFRSLVGYLQSQNDSTYTIITGNAGVRYFLPNISLLCVGSGALNGLALAARSEYNDGQMAVNEFNIHCLVHPQPDSELQADDINLGNDLIGQAVVACVTAGSRDRTTVHNRQEVQAVIQS